jgi:hypothetical protein
MEAPNSLEVYPMTDSEANVSATADFTGSDTVSIQGELEKSDSFYQGAAWSLKRLAAWLETTNFVANGEVAQRSVDATKALIAEQAKHAADNFLPRNRPRPARTTGHEKPR